MKKLRLISRAVWTILFGLITLCFKNILHRLACGTALEEGRECERWRTFSKISLAVDVDDVGLRYEHFFKTDATKKDQG